MANLYPISSLPNPQIQEVDSVQSKFGRNVEYDYTNREFVVSPLGRQYLLNEVDSWVEWCVKALSTPRYKHMLVYSGNYGSELHTLIGKCYPHPVAESQIRRMVKECLLADKRTATVEKFTFEWIDDGIIFTCEISNIHGDSRYVGGKVVV